ncbi:MAG: sigma-70 family RNA polymerase sigma factor [Actinomycetota bacterium]|jgi:RNA polymerase sigma factor (sigma-70 family)|nr:sigma-70 family RNA polymerase sigma factor [Actinomycetota bacterium]
MAALDLSEARDRELMLRIGSGDQEAFRGLFRRYGPAAKALALRVVRQTHLAEEIVQEAFTALWKNPEGYDQRRGSVKSWLMGMVHHRAVDLVRREEAHRRRAERSIPAALETEPDPADQVVEQVDAPEERRAVRAALGELPPEQRQVIERMYFEGRSQSQIAAELDLPLGTVKSRTLLGMRRLRGALAGMER